MSTSNIKQFSQDLSDSMADSVETAAGFTVLVDARKRMPFSGVVIKPDLVLSVDHGIETEDNIRVLLPNGNVAAATLVGRDPGSDLALLRLDQKVDKIFESAGRPARVGQPVIALGKPEPIGIQASFGIITALGEGLRTMRGSVIEKYIATDATPYPGFSGGPLISLTGEVVGINTSGLVGGTSIAIPIQIALNVATQLETFGKVKRGFLGVKSQRVEINETIRRDGAIAQKTGLLLVGVEANGPADRFGLMVGDILTRIDSQVVADQDDLFIALTGGIVGKSVMVEVVRGGKMSSVPVTIGEKG